MVGPMSGRYLADLGADVIKVEAPEGDSLRHYRPLRSPGMAGNILNLHRNKRSIVLDLKTAAGRDALDRLARDSVHQGVLAVAAARRFASLEDVASGAGMLVVLDGVEDPHNLGAVIRTAHAAGAKAVADRVAGLRTGVKIAVPARSAAVEARPLRGVAARLTATLMMTCLSRA